MKNIKIERIQFKPMRHKLHCEYHKDVLKIVDKLTQEVILIMEFAPLLELYRSCIETQKSLLGMVFKSKYSDEIVETDRNRDKTFSGLKSVVKAMLYHFDPEMQKAAAHIMYYFKRYKNITKKGYDEKSIEIKSFLRNLGGENNMKDLQTLGMTCWYDHLKVYNDHFEYLTHQRYREKAAMPAMRMVDARKKTDECYHRIVTYLEYLQIIGRSLPDEVQTFITELNAIVKNYKDMMASQRSDKPEEPKEETKE